MLNKMRIIAIDPGYDRLGVAVLEKNPEEKVLFSSCFETDRKTGPEKRLSSIDNFFKETAKKWEVNALAIEKLFFAKNQKTALAVAEARGVILAGAGALNLFVFEFGPGEIKVAITGYGKSDKKQIKTMVERLVSLPNEKRRDDEYDAIAIGLTALAHLKQKVFPPPPFSKSI